MESQQLIWAAQAALKPGDQVVVDAARANRSTVTLMERTYPPRIHWACHGARVRASDGYEWNTRLNRLMPLHLLPLSLPHYDA